MTVPAGMHTYITGSSLAASLATYDFGSGAEPAVFTIEPAPEDTKGPFIIITQVGGDFSNVRDRTTRGGNIDIDVKLWGDRDNSHKVLRDLSYELWQLLDRATFDVDGYHVLQCLSDPPGYIGGDRNFPGYLLRCGVLIRESVSIS